MEDPTVELVKRAARGDQEAFTEFFDLFYTQVYNFALWLCGDADQAQDLTQETFIKAHSGLGKLGPPWNARPWLFRIARNRYVDHYRHRQPVQALDPEAPLASGEADPERQAMQSDQARLVQRAIQRIAPNYREALLLREVEGFHYDQIAEIMGISMDGVKVLIHRARLSFKEQYGVRLLTEEPLPNCDVLNEVLDEFCDGESLEAQERAVKAHLKECAACQQRTRELAALSALLRLLPPQNPPKDLRRKVLARAKRGLPRRMLTIGAVIAAVLLIGGGVVAAFGGGGQRGGTGSGNNPIIAATPTRDAPTPTSGIFSAVETPSVTPTDTPTATATGSLTPTVQRITPAVPVITRTPTTGVTVTVTAKGITVTPGGITPTLIGADGSLCGDGICQPGENASWCGDCSQSSSGGGITDTPVIVNSGPSPSPVPVCGNGILEAGEQCEHNSDCTGNPAGNQCFIPGCLCGPG